MPSQIEPTPEMMASQDLHDAPDVVPVPWDGGGLMDEGGDDGDGE